MRYHKITTCAKGARTMPPHDNTTNAPEIPAPLPTDPASFELRVFDPKRIRLFRVAGVTRLTWENERSWTKVAVARAFPLSDPGHYIGFLDGAGKDIGLLYDPDPLDSDSRRIMD